MLIEIETFEGGCYLWGKTMAVSKIKEQMNQILKEVSEADFTDVFCSRFGYEQVNPPEEEKADLVIDLDIHRIYQPRF